MILKEDMLYLSCIIKAKESIKDHTTSSFQSSEVNVGVVSDIYISKKPP
jgi:hypothetical protein